MSVNDREREALSRLAAAGCASGSGARACTRPCRVVPFAASGAGAALIGVGAGDYL